MIVNERMEKVRSAMAERCLEAMIVKGRENKIYLTGNAPEESALVITAEKSYLLTDSRYIEAVSLISEKYCFEPVLITRDRTETDFLTSLGLNAFGIEYDLTNVSEYNKITEALGDKCSVENSSGIVEDLRAVKSSGELKRMRNAAALADQAFGWVLDKLVPGAVEQQVAFMLEVYMRENGASGLSFDTILISGPKTSMPHGIPGDRKIEKGDFVTLDFGCVLDGYCSDMTRTVAAGPINDRQKLVYDTVLEAQLKGCREIKPGMTCRQADRVCRDVIREAGFGEYFGHGLGHGVGLEIHELPTVSFRSERALEENMIITIEPGIYLPGEFGVRIEDMAAVTADGIENFCSSPKELIFTC